MTIDAQILKFLRSAGSAGVSSVELAEKLTLPADTIQERISQMRALGYDIRADPHHGFNLISVPDVLHADDLLSQLRPVRVIGRDIQVFQETTSTNDVVERLGRDGVKEGVVVFAESQTQGRGRMGRRWESPPGKGLWFSLLLRPSFPPTAATQLTIAAATALIRALKAETALELTIKWPNDLLIGSRKTAGILSELSADSERIHHVVLGIGVDVNLTEADLPPELRTLATSLRIESGRLIPRAPLAAAILRELDRDYARIVDGQFAAIADEWEAQCSTLGRNVSMRVGPRTINGRAESLDDDGALLVRTEHGHLERMVGGDIVLL